MTFLAIDVGNTRLKWALYAAPAPGAVVLAQGVEFLENIEKLADGPWSQLAPPQRMLGCAVAAVAVKRRVEEQMEELWPTPPHWVVSSSAEAGLVNGYDHPTRLGADRWVAMIGAWHRQLARGGPRPCGPSSAFGGATRRAPCASSAATERACRSIRKAAPWRRAGVRRLSLPASRAGARRSPPSQAGRKHCGSHGRFVIIHK